MARADQPVLAVRDVAVIRGNTLALKRADLTITRPGEVHALLGQNGSGKSTLLGVLSGQLRPSRGEVVLNGAPLKFADTVGARNRGIATVSQERALAPALSVAENMLMGRGLVRRGAIRWRRSFEQAARALDELGFDIDARAKAGGLRPDRQQLVEIARAVVGDPRLLILDEPTSSLSGDEVGALFDVIRRLSARGVSTVIVSHRLSELYGICDRITVLRDGQTVLESEMAATTPDLLIEAMVGTGAARPPSSAASPRVPAEHGRVVLELSKVSASAPLREIDFTVRSGEIVGVTGLAGCGSSELLEVVAGVRQSTGGQMTLGGASYRPARVRDAIDSGVAYVPPDRKTQGLYLGMSITENLATIRTRSRPRLGRPDRRAEAARAQAVIDEFGVRTPSRDSTVGSLSGGNQQKVAIGKCVESGPSLFLLDEPTRGVDIAARMDIHDRLRALAGEGVAVVMASGDIEELLEVCDRILVLARGRVVGELPTAGSDEQAVVRLAGGEQ